MTWLVAAISIFVADAQLNQWRMLFFDCHSDANRSVFYNQIISATLPNNRETAYKGVATAMYASCVGWPGEKIDYFNQGKDILERCVKGDPNDAEVRFLRYSVQCETPGFMGYSSNKKDDIAVIISFLQRGVDEGDKWFWSKAAAYILTKNDASEQQKTILRTHAQ
jgi:hypothetical protein